MRPRQRLLVVILSDTDDLETSITDPVLIHECGLSSMKEFHTPLYDGAELSVLDSHLLMYQYALRHCITTQAFMELISLVETHMPWNSRAIWPLYKLRKFFEENFNDTKCQVYEYCSKCHRLLIDSETTGVPCSSGCEGATVNKFMYVPVESQLEGNRQHYVIPKWFMYTTYTCLEQNKPPSLFDLIVPQKCNHHSLRFICTFRDLRV